jgi:hypothetical protein
MQVLRTPAGYPVPIAHERQIMPDATRVHDVIAQARPSRQMPSLHEAQRRRGEPRVDAGVGICFVVAESGIGLVRPSFRLLLRAARCPIRLRELGRGEARLAALPVLLRGVAVAGTPTNSSKLVSSSPSKARSAAANSRRCASAASLRATASELSTVASSSSHSFAEQEQLLQPGRLLATMAQIREEGHFRRATGTHR